MKEFQERILKPIVVIALIIALTLVEFLVVGMQIVSYAIENIETTNMENVLFSAVFVDRNGNETDFLETDMKDEDSKLKIAIKVEKEGYFNGEIHIDDTNFKLKTDIDNDYINSISEDTIKLNQITAGSEVILELGIQAIKDDEYKLEYLNRTSDVSISGTYVMGKNSEKQINATRQLGLKFNPENFNDIELSADIITNKIYTVGEENKRIVQLEITSKLQDNKYPIERTKIVTDMLSDAEDVYVSKRGTYATNNDYRDIEVNKSDNEVAIEILNSEENGTIRWNKNGQDKVIVTYILPENANVTNKQLSVNSEIELYDENNTIINSESNVSINEEKDGIISYELQGQDELYKGYLYYGEESNIITKTIIDIKAKNVLTAVKVAEGNARYTDQNTANLKYYSTRVDKEDARRILGDSGRIEIKSESGMTLGTIDREFIEQTESDKIEISYEGQHGLIIEIHNIANEGRIEFEHNVVLQEDAELKEQLKNFNELKIDGTLTTDKNIQEKQSEKDIELKEPETFAKFTSNTDTLSTLQTNENIEFNVILKTDDIKYDLYKNPTVEIRLPSEITNIEASFNGVFLDNLEVRNASIYDTENGNKAMRIELEGEQEEHSSNLSEGIILNINANIDVSKLTSTKDSEIKMLYTNDNLNGNVFEKSIPIKIKSKEGLLVYNKVENFNDNGDVIETEETKTLTETLYEDSQGKEVNANTVLVNNYETEIKNVKIIGKNADDATIDLNILKNININKNSKISYSANGEDWVDNADEIEEVKAYKIETEQIESHETIESNYEFKIPDELDYNQMAKLEQSVSYEYQGQELNQVFGLELQTEKMQLAEENNKISVGQGNTDEVTGELEVKTTTKLATKELTEQDTVYEGETLTNTITLTNKTGRDLNNVVVKVNQENAVQYGLVEEEVINYYVSSEPYIEHTYGELETGEKTFETINTIKSGEVVKLEYEAVVNQVDGDNEKTYGQIEVSTQGIDTIYKNTIENTIKQAEIKVNSKMALNQEVELYTNSYAPTIVTIENINGNEIENVNVTIKLNGLHFEVDEEDTLDEVLEDYIFFAYENDNEIDDVRIENLQYDESNNLVTFKINSLETNGKIEVVLDTSSNRISTDDNETTVGIVTTINTESNKEYISNIALRKILQSEKDITLTQESNVDDDTILKHGDNITIKLIVENNENKTNSFMIYDTFNKAFTIDSVKRKIGNNIIELDEQAYENNRFKYEDSIDANSKIEYEINIIINAKDLDNDSISNSAQLGFEEDQYSWILSNELIFSVDEDSFVYVDDDDDDDADENVISGIAWLDNDKNGRMDSSEKKLSGIKVRLADKNTGNIIEETQTNEDGDYSFDVEDGEYIVIFLYDNEKYNITEYKKAGVSEKENSDVISKSIIIDNVETLVGITDSILISNSGMNNVNIGLIEKEIFDLRLDKYVSKISVQSQGETYVKEYEKEQLAKLEIGEKYYNGAFVAIEYQINITNEGETEGYANDIIDYLPTGLKFSSELNSDWYMTNDGSIHNISLENEKISPGETKTLNLVLTKTLSSSDGGLMSNTAEIYKCSNNQNISDKDSTPGNRKTGEDDISTASVLISVSTGIVKISLTIVFIILIIAGTTVIILKRKEGSLNE